MNNANTRLLDELGIQKVMAMLPHRYPILLIDRVISCQPGESLVAIKNISTNEFFVPTDDNLPGVFPQMLLVESMAQATGLLAMSSAAGLDQRHAFFLIGIDKARFYQPARVGDCISIIVRVIRATQGVGKFLAQAKNHDRLIAKVELMCAARTT